MLWHLQPIFEGRLRSAAIGLGHHQRVLEHDVIEAGPFQRQRKFDVELPVPRGTAVGERRVPCPRSEIGKPSQMEAFRQPALLGVILDFGTRWRHLRARCFGPKN